MLVGWHMDVFKVAIAIETVDYFIFIFRCTIITKHRINIGYSWYVVIITYSQLVYYLYNLPHHPSTAAIAIVHDHIIKFVQILQSFHTIINNNTNI